MKTVIHALLAFFYLLMPSSHCLLSSSCSEDKINLSQVETTNINSEIWTYQNSSLQVSKIIMGKASGILHAYGSFKTQGTNATFIRRDKTIVINTTPSINGFAVGDKEDHIFVTGHGSSGKTQFILLDDQLQITMAKILPEVNITNGGKITLDQENNVYFTAVVNSTDQVSAGVFVVDASNFKGVQSKSSQVVMGSTLIPTADQVALIALLETTSSQDSDETRLMYTKYDIKNGIPINSYKNSSVEALYTSGFSKSCSAWFETNGNFYMITSLPNINKIFLEILDYTSGTISTLYQYTYDGASTCSVNDFIIREPNNKLYYSYNDFGRTYLVYHNLKTDDRVTYDVKPNYIVISTIYNQKLYAAVGSPAKRSIRLWILEPSNVNAIEQIDFIRIDNTSSIPVKMTQFKGPQLQSLNLTTEELTVERSDFKIEASVVTLPPIMYYLEPYITTKEFSSRINLTNFNTTNDFFDLGFAHTKVSFEDRYKGKKFDFKELVKDKQIVFNEDPFPQNEDQIKLEFLLETTVGSEISKNYSKPLILTLKQCTSHCKNCAEGTGSNGWRHYDKTYDNTGVFGKTFMHYLSPLSIMICFLTLFILSRAKIISSVYFVEMTRYYQMVALLFLIVVEMSSDEKHTHVSYNFEAITDYLGRGILPIFTPFSPVLPVYMFIGVIITVYFSFALIIIYQAIMMVVIGFLGVFIFVESSLTLKIMFRTWSRLLIKHNLMLNLTTLMLFTINGNWDRYQYHISVPILFVFWICGFVYYWSNVFKQLLYLITFGEDANNWSLDTIFGDLVPLPSSLLYEFLYDLIRLLMMICLGYIFSWNKDPESLGYSIGVIGIFLLHVVWILMTVIINPFRVRIQLSMTLINQVFCLSFYILVCSRLLKRDLPYLKDWNYIDSNISLLLLMPLTYIGVGSKILYDSFTCLKKTPQEDRLLGTQVQVSTIVSSSYHNMSSA